MPNIKNIIIFTAIGASFILVYIFFIKSSPEEATLISSSPVSRAPSTGITIEDPSVAQDFLSLLLSVQGIKLDDAIFSDNAFSSLRDSSITLTPDGNEGRPNPFAPFGTENIVLPASTGSLGTKTGASALP